MVSLNDAQVAAAVPEAAHSLLNIFASFVV
jgi:hypothetical protein